MKRRQTFNPKRQLASARELEHYAPLEKLAELVGYGGNPEHKRNPGDFGLTPPSSPRPAKTLCDDALIFTRGEAESLLREGIRRGFLSAQSQNDWPKNIWAVTDRGVPLEAQIENPVQGMYHGYPMPTADPFRSVVIERWGPV